MGAIDLSVVVPMFNEADVLPVFLERLGATLQAFDGECEIVFVDDGSIDDSVAVLKSVAAHSPVPTRCIQLAVNSGHMTALRVGIQHAKGELLATMDADLQDPPELLPQMVTLLRSDNFDVVQAERTSRKSDSWFKRWTAHLYYRGMAAAAGIPELRNVADYRVFTRSVASEILRIPERQSVYRLLLPSLGYRIGYVGYARPARVAGESKYSIPKMTRLAIDSLTSFSVRPLRAMSTIGGVLSILFLLCSILSVIAWAAGSTVPGWTSLVFLVLMSNAALLAAVGLVGEYVGKTFEQVRGRPQPRTTEIDLLR